jgi:hypothetical protein
MGHHPSAWKKLEPGVPITPATVARADEIARGCSDAGDPRIE